MPDVRSLAALSLLLPLASSAAGCAAPVAPPATAPGGPTAATTTAASGASLEERLAREATAPGAVRHVVSPTTGIALDVAATTAPTLTAKTGDDGPFEVLTFGIGSDVAVTCQLRTSAADYAHVFANLETAVGATLVAAPRVTVEVHEGNPLLGIEGDGQITGADGVTKRHFLKYAAVDLEGGALFCVHDDAGYRKTFRAAMAQIAASARVDRPGQAAALVNVEVMRRGGRVVGAFVQRAYAADEKGQRLETAMFSGIETDGQRWAAVDGGWSGTVDGSGVVRERSVRRFAGATTVDMTLERQGAGRYAFSGTVHDKPKQGTFTTSAPLVTLLSRAPLVAATGDRETAFAHFSEHEPEKPVRDTVRRVGPGVVRISEGDTTFDCTVGQGGFCTKLVGADTTYTQLHVKGELPRIRKARR